MTRYIYLVLACVLMSTLAYSQSQSIQGRIYDAKSNEGLPFANVILLKDGIQKAGTTTDLDGNYSFTGFDPGTYDVEAVYVGYPNARMTGVRVSASQSLPLDIEMSAEQGVDLDVVTVTEYRIPLIKQDETASGNTLGGEDIKKLPTRSVTTLIATTAAVSQDKEGEAVSFRGAREGDQIVYVDGVRVRGNSVPAQDIEQIQVITGGVPAAYGDVTGGVTNIITKGAASQFSGSVDLETSELIDGFGYNFATASLSGPIWKRTVVGTNGATRDETVLGFRISGQFVTQADPSPSYLGSYRATDAFRNSILENPFNADGTLRLSNITASDVERIKARENARDTDYTINGKFDFVPASGMTFTVGGQYFSSDAKQAFDSYRLLNADRNPSYLEKDWRAFARFRHTIGGNLLDLSDEEREARTSALMSNPYSADGGLALDNIMPSDIERLTARENARDTDISLNGKLDFVPMSGMTFTLGGQYFNSNAKQAFNSYKLLNYDRNPSFMESDWRAFARFRHSIGGNLLDLSDEEREARTSALIQNINYSLQFDIDKIMICIRIIYIKMICLAMDMLFSLLEIFGMIISFRSPTLRLTV